MTRWLEIARKYDGLAEIKGPNANPVILGWLHKEGKGRSWVKDDATPWCGAAMAGVFTEAGLSSVVPNAPLMAKSWANVGVPLDGPRVGAIVVLPRRDPKNKDAAHVGLVESFTETTLMVRGGNQRDRFGVDEFARFDARGKERGIYRWPVPIKTPSEIEAEGSRIAARAKRQQRDTAIGGALGTAPQTVPVSAPPELPAMVETVNGWLGQMSWAQGALDQIAGFAAFLGAKWPWLVVVVAAYFGARVLWDGYLIRQFRTQDANEGYSA